MRLLRKFGLLIFLAAFLFSLSGNWASVVLAYENIKFDAVALPTNGHFDFSDTGEAAYPLGEVTPTCPAIKYGIKSYSINKGTYPGVFAPLGSGTGLHPWP